jgi:iron complex outermembrane receptor protein
MKNVCRARAIGFSGAALWVLAAAMPAAAQEQPQSGAAVAGTPAEAVEAQNTTVRNEALAGDIVVTATRRNERLQDVPVTVTVVSDEQIQKLQIKNFTDIQVLSPGLSFRASGDQGTVTSLRGISSTVTTSAPAAVVIYFNEIPVNDYVAFQGIYDVGQIEVLRGPQGTLRGVAAPVGSITIGTRRPDLTEIGGTGIVTYTNQPNFNGQAAINVPIVNDVLAIRVAGLYDRNENGDIRNPTNGVESRANTKSARASVLFQPIPPLSIFASYQYMRSNSYSLTQVRGTGFVPTAAQPFPAGYNGPPIGGRDRLAVQETTAPRQFTSNVASINARPR